MSSSGSSMLRRFATVDLKSTAPIAVQNFVNGAFAGTERQLAVVDPLAKSRVLLQVADTQVHEARPFLDQLARTTKSGLHNPLKRPERYVTYGQVCHRLGQALDDPEVEAYFSGLIQKVLPKSYAQCLGEVRVTRTFLKSFAGDATRFAVGRGFSVSGDHPGQESRGYRWPYGAVAVIAPFNFPLEIPVLQAVGAVIAGNRVVVKPAEKVSIVFEQFLRLMLECGAPPEDILLLNGGGQTTQHVVTSPVVRLTQFTGSSAVAEMLAEKTRGRVRVEDAGFNWKVLGPRGPLSQTEIDYVAQVCDQDAYAASGQKCSAQSCLFVHSSWVGKANEDIVDRIKKFAARRKFEDLTIGPVITWSTKKILDHMNKCLKTIPNCTLAFGGTPLEGRGADQVAPEYGMVTPTALRCHVKDVLSSDAAFEAFSTELFGPFQIILDFEDSDVDLVVECCERMSHHLTAAVVSDDPNFTHKMLANTLNGTTYAGFRARTTGAPTNHWFGPAGDPRGSGIGTIEAIVGCWTCHREIVHDVLRPPADWKLQPPS